MSKRHVVTKNSWIPRIAELCRQAGVCGVDSETYSDPKYTKDYLLYGLDCHRNKIRSVQIATKECAWFIDLHQVTEIEPLRQLLLDADVIKVIHNALFETTMFLKHWDCYPENVFDTQLASQLYHKAGSLEKHNLGAVAARYLNIYVDKEEQVSNWRDELSDAQIEYAFKDAEILIPLYEAQSEMLERDGMTFAHRIECDAVLGFADMQVHGMKCDLDVINKIGTVIDKKRWELRRELGQFFKAPVLSLFEEECGPVIINLESVPQQLEALANLGIYPEAKDKKTGEMKPSTSKGALLAAMNKKNAGLINSLIQYKGLKKLISSYIKPMPGFIHPVTGKIHGNWRPIGQAQHRPSCKAPNYLQMPRPDKTNAFMPEEVMEFEFDEVTGANKTEKLSFRHAFLAESGSMFSIADFANNQARIVADRAQVKALIAGFNAKRDVYKQIASAVLNKPYEEITKDQRQDAKVWVLAFFFGAGWKRFQQAVLELARLSISDKKAREQRDAFFNGLPELEVWHEEEPAFVAENGYVETPDGRRIWFDMNRLDDDGRPKLPRNDAINFPICGTEVDGAKKAVGQVARYIRREKYDTRKVHICGYIYDEIFVQVPERQGDDFFAVQQKIMTDCMQSVLKTVPAAVDGGVGPNWASK